jgi:hypothetical protein
MGYNIYENENFIPMGFAYNSYITRDTFEKTYTDNRSKLLLKAMLLEEDGIAKTRIF